MATRERDFKPAEGRRIRVGELQRMGEALSRISSISAPGLVEGGHGLTFVKPQPDWFWLKLTAKDASSPIKYDWELVVPDGEGGFQTPAGGPSGDATSLPAYEINGKDVDLTVDVYAMGFFSTFNIWFFSPGGTTVPEFASPAIFHDTVTFEEYVTFEVGTTFEGDNIYQGGNTYESTSTTNYESGAEVTFESGSTLIFNDQTTNNIIYIGSSNQITGSPNFGYDPASSTITNVNPGANNNPAVLKLFQIPAGPANMALNAVPGKILFGGQINAAPQDFAGIVPNYLGDGTTRTGNMQFYTYNGGVQNMAMTVRPDGFMQIEQGTADTMMYIDSDKSLKSATLGSGLSLSGGTLSITGSYQPLDSDLSAIAGFNATGFLRQQGTGVWSVEGETGTGNVVRASALGSYLTTADAATTYQPLDATLTALAGYNTNGILCQTAADTFVGRTLTGTAARVSVSNGNGVSGNPTVDIDSSYVGQATITTLGTITTGTWQGTRIGSAYGGVPSGSVTQYAGSSVPSGWLECDGSAVSRTTYADLFTAISTTWGAGDGSTTFNLPDLRGRAPIGVGTGSGLTARTLGGTGGTETHTLVESELPAHTHNTITKSSATGFGAAGAVTRANAVTDGSVATSSTGSDGAHNNMQPWAALKFIIKT